MKLESYKILNAIEDPTLRILLEEQSSFHPEYCFILRNCAHDLQQDMHEMQPHLLLTDQPSHLLELENKSEEKEISLSHIPLLYFLLPSSPPPNAPFLEENPMWRFIQLPTRFSLILQTIRSLLALAQVYEETKPLEIGGFSFDRRHKSLLKDHQEEVRLTEKEAALLECLFKARPHAVARDVLLKEVWGYKDQMMTHTLETHIYRLRQKLEPDPNKTEILITEEGGYRLA